MSATKIVWAWGTNTHIAFNPATDILDFGWFAAGQFTISEVNGSVVIAIPSNHQIYTLDNTTLELVAPNGEGANADRIRAVLAAQGEGLASICFRTSDIAKMHRRLDRLTLKPDPVAEVESRDAISGATLSWKRTRAATEASRGVRLFFLERDKERPLSVRTTTGSITAMDHVVVSTSDPERAAALYGARLGLDMALEIGRAHV